MSLFWKTYLRINGWSQRGEFPYHLRKCVIIVGPHTSAWDFVIGLGFRNTMKLKHSHFLGKQELFQGPFGWWFRSLGGTPVDRFSRKNMVEQAVDMFRGKEDFMLALSPEGTRKKVDKLRSGFYHIAKGAGVPIVMIGLDFGKKQCVVGDHFYPSGDEAADFKRIIEFFASVEGKIPENGVAHLL